MNAVKFVHNLTMGCVCGREFITIDDRNFNICGRLGEGGFSVIDLIEDRQTKHQFALKRILCHSEEDERDALKEVHYMNSFRHLNLVPCEAYTTLPVNNHLTAISEVLIVMPFYRKGSVYDELERLRGRTERMAESQIIHLLLGVCEAIRVLHCNRGVVLAHRDIKPHNIMLEVGEVNDIPILMDFGSMGPARQEVKGMSDALRVQDFAAEKCSMPFRAPELFQVESYCIIDEKVDIWSLGCTLYAMCFYESPFDKVHQRGDSVALAAMAGNIQVPDQNQFSSALVDLMMLMLSVNPVERPNVETIISKLQQFPQTSDRV